MQSIKPKLPETMLVNAQGVKLIVPFRPSEPEFTYNKRLWAFNRALTQRHGQAIYTEITIKMVEDMFAQSKEVHSIASKFLTMLESIHKPQQGEIQC